MGSCTGCHRVGAAVRTSVVITGGGATESLKQSSVRVVGFNTHFGCQVENRL